MKGDGGALLRTCKIESSSPEFDEFLGIIGDRIQLKGWTGYRGGLSNKESEVTGKESVFTKFDGYNIMFHVSTLLPYNANDLQQLERKRHVGNDIVTIVFQDEPGILFSPLTISSHFLRTVRAFLLHIFDPCVLQISLW